MKVFIGSDRLGFERKEQIIIYLDSNGYNVIDVGPFEYKSVHYPEIAILLSHNVCENIDSFGILICSTGIGMSIAANKINGIRAANCMDVFMAEHARLHNNANVLCIGSDIISTEDSKKIVAQFLSSSFEGGKHSKRVNMLNNIK